MGSLEDWLQLSRPLAFPRSSLRAGTTCVAPVGNAGLMTPGSSALPALLYGLQICSGVCQRRAIRKPDLEREANAEALASPSECCVFIGASGSSFKLLEEKDAVAVLFAVTPRPGLPMHVLECMHTHERKVLLQ